jgi:hypothetical protein
MKSNGLHTCDRHDFKASSRAAGQQSGSDRAQREKNRFWIEQPARRFVVYFCALVTAESLVYGTLHGIFHLL